MPENGLAILLGILFFAANVAISAESVGQPPRPIRRSDVVFMYDNPEQYDAYGCTVLGWAGWGNADRIELAHSKGIRLFSTSVGFLTEFRRVIDFDEDFLDAACRNFAGEPYIVPWLWDHKHQHKGQPAWWWCTNSPLYRKFLESRLEEVAEAEPDGLHIDDCRGTSGSVTWLSGGFCPHCMLTNPQALAIAPCLSYFCCEVGHAASRRADGRVRVALSVRPWIGFTTASKTRWFRSKTSRSVCAAICSTAASSPGRRCTPREPNRSRWTSRRTSNPRE